MKELRKRRERGEENVCEKRMRADRAIRFYPGLEMHGWQSLYRILCYVFDYISRICWGNGLVREVTEI
jgi:hypothetical protein